MMVAGLDIGGTKIEVQIFDEDWNEVARNRCATPEAYEDLVRDIASQIRWATEEAGGLDAIGVGTAGLVNPRNGSCIDRKFTCDGSSSASKHRTGHWTTDHFRQRLPRFGTI